MNGARAEGNSSPTPAMPRRRRRLQASSRAAPAATSSAATSRSFRPAAIRPIRSRRRAPPRRPLQAGRRQDRPPPGPVGSNGRDRLIGGPGRDRLAGKFGDDKIVGGKGGPDCLLGGQGHDRIRSVNGRSDVVKCGPGRDRATVESKDRVRGCERIVTRRS